MYSYEYMPFEWFAPGRQPRPPQYRYRSPMSRPVSKNFNRISDFIFPDTVHVRLPSSSNNYHYYQQQNQRYINPRYQRTDNYSLPVLNQRDLIIVERLPADEFNDIDLVYREQYNEPNRRIRRRHTSYLDEDRWSSNERPVNGLKTRSIAYREKYRDRRKRHTTDNVYQSVLRTIVDEDPQQQCKQSRNSNYILSYKTTLDPITDSESMTSINEENHQSRINDDTSNYRVRVNRTESTTKEHVRSRKISSTISTQDSSSDTEINERHPKTMNCVRYQQDSSYIISPDIPANDWEHVSSNDVERQHQSDLFSPIIPTNADTNTYETVSDSNNLITSSTFNNVINDKINNQASSQDSIHHVSLCVNDLNTTLFIDEDTFDTKFTSNNNNNDKKAVIKNLIDRIIKRLQHFKHSLDNGLTNMRKKNTFMKGPIISEDYHSHVQTRKERTDINKSVNIMNEIKLSRPYFLIKPQSVLMLPNETAKFKCCFGGDPYPTLIWSHNESRIPEAQVIGDVTSSRYRAHKLNDIHYLDIGPINLSDQGQIKCKIMNNFGHEEIIVQLLVVPSPADATPYIVQPLDNITIIEGQLLELSCVINGLQVTVNWFHNGKLISPMPIAKGDYDNERSMFTLSRCTKTDAGTVECFVKNRFGEARTSCRIEVIDATEHRNR